MSQSTEAHRATLIRRVLPMSSHAPAMAREALDDLADDLAPDLLRDTKLLVSELVANRVRRPRDPAGTLALKVTLTEPLVRVQVAYDDRRSAPVHLEAGEPVLGWDLQIVAEVADRWGVQRNGISTVWFELDR